jgi:large repetitive protein
MMLKLLLILFIPLIFQACQVSEDVASSKQLNSTNNFPGATLTTGLQANGWKKLGDNIDVSLLFPLPVTVTNSPYINSKIGSYTRRFYYFSGSGSTGLIFRYTVTSADMDEDGITFDSAIELNGGTLTYSPQPAVTANVPTTLSFPPSQIKVDGIIPYLTQVAAPPGGNYATNQQLKYHLSFSEKVNVSGLPKFNLNLNSPFATANYKSGSGTSGFILSSFANSCFPSGDCPATQTSGLSTITFPASATSTFGSFMIGTPNGNLTIFLGTFNGVNTICGLCSAADKATNLATIITKSTNPIMADYYATATGNSVKIYKGTVLEFSRQIQVADSDSDGFTTSTLLNLSTPSGITILDQAGNSISSTIHATTSTNVLINVVQPTIVNVSTPAAFTYTVGQPLNFTVTMSAPVNVTGTPSIPIALSTGTVLANYVSGTGTNTLLFTYVVQPNHVDNDGITLISPMLLNGGTIKNLLATQNAALVYTVPATPLVLVDAATGPYVISVLKPANGMYFETANLDFTLNFNRVVNFSGVGVARLPIIVGSTLVYANYLSGIGTTALTFRYTVTTTDEDLDGISLSSPIDLTGTFSIIDAANKPAILAFAPPNTTGILVDGTSPTIVSVSGTGSGILAPGQHLNFSVQFSEVVTVVAPNPTLSITVGLTGYSAIYLSGSGTNTLNFRYTIIPTNEGGVTVSSLLLNGGTIQDPRGHNAVLAFAPTPIPGYVVDGVASIASLVLPVAPPVNGYKIGDVLNFKVNWDEDTFITGSPRLALKVGPSTYYATYVPLGSTLTSFNFNYTVLANHLDTDGIETTGIELNGGQLKDAAGNNSNYSFPIPPGLLAAYKIDGVVPYVTTLIPPASITYIVGQNLVFTLVWDGPVNVNGSPVLNLTIGSTPVTTSCVFATVITTTATCTYPVQAGQLDTNGITLASAIGLGSGITIKDLAGNDSYLQINPPDLTGVKVDAVAPTISSVTPPTSGTYQRDEFVDFRVNWSEPITITVGTPQIKLLVGSDYRFAVYQPGLSTSSMSIFRYQVLLNDEDVNGVTIEPPSPAVPFIDLNGATIKDLAGNIAVSTFFIRPDTSGVKIDGKTPYVTFVTSANGLYIEGQTIYFTLNWIENMLVDVTFGIPTVQIDVGGSFKSASYDSTVGNQTVFKYEVLVGDEDNVNGISLAGPITLNGGIITDVPGNNANLAVPVTAFHQVKVDAKAPTITNAGSWKAVPVYVPGEWIWYQIYFHEPVQLLSGAPYLKLNIGGTNVVATYAGFAPGQGNKIIEFKYQIPAGNTVLDLNGVFVDPQIYDGGGIEDFSGHALVASGFPGGVFPEVDYVYYSNMVARYHVSGSDYSSASCGANTCITGLTDISGKGKHITVSAAVGPIVGPTAGLGYGSSGSQYMQFSTTPRRYLPLPSLSNVKYIFAAIKSATYATNTVFMENSVTTDYVSSTTSGYSFGVPHTHIIQNGSNYFNDPTGMYYYPMAHSVNTNYLNLFVSKYPQNLTNSTVGGNTSNPAASAFNGQVAELIYLSGANILNSTQLNMIYQQLRAIHGVY